MIETTKILPLPTALKEVVCLGYYRFVCLYCMHVNKITQNVMSSSGPIQVLFQCVKVKDQVGIALMTVFCMSVSYGQQGGFRPVGLCPGGLMSRGFMSWIPQLCDVRIRTQLYKFHGLERHRATPSATHGVLTTLLPLNACKFVTSRFLFWCHIIQLGDRGTKV